MDCKFCNKHFGTNSTLLTHQKTAKYCLKIQARHRDKVSEQPANQPTVEELQAIIAHKDIEIDKYKKLLEEALKNTESTTNITRNFYIVTDEQYNNVFGILEGIKNSEPNSDSE